MADFKDFIIEQLRRAELNQKTIEKLTTPERIEEWGIAFTHKSISVKANENYEVKELIGDRIIESIVTSYIYKKLSVVNTGFISKIKTNIVQKKGLARVGLKYGFSEHIKYSEEIEEKIRDIPEDEIDRNTIYASLIEDTVEAFTGVMVDMIDEVNNVAAGPGYAVAHNWWWSILNEMDISTSYVAVWDPVSRLKEIFDSLKNKGWVFDRSIMTREEKMVFDPKIQKERPYFTITYYAYLKGDRTASRNNRVQIGKATDISVEKAKQEAARKGLAMLKRYGISDIPKDPFKRTNK